jgi:hypothetical protein
LHTGSIPVVALLGLGLGRSRPDSLIEASLSHSMPTGGSRSGRLWVREAKLGGWLIQQLRATGTIDRTLIAVCWADGSATLDLLNIPCGMPQPDDASPQ